MTFWPVFVITQGVDNVRKPIYVTRRVNFNALVCWFYQNQCIFSCGCCIHGFTGLDNAQNMTSQGVDNVRKHVSTLLSLRNKRFRHCLPSNMHQ